jgi:zinc protease
VAQPSLQRSYLAPSYATGKGDEAEAIELLMQIVGAGSVSRLYQTLVVEKGLASNAGGWYTGSALDMSRLGTYATPRPGVTLPQLEEALDAVLDTVVDKGVTADELERAKTRLIADLVYANDSQSTLARMYGAALTTGTSVEQVKAWPDRVRAVTAESVQAVARRYLDKRRSVTGYLVKDVAREEKRS